MTRSLRFRNPWNSEAEIAIAVRQALESTGWEVHPECNGYDLFAVSRDVQSLEEGLTLGCECKLDAGTAAGYASLLRQILPQPGLGTARWRVETEGFVYDYFRPPNGVHYRLAASARFADESLLLHCGVVVWRMAELRIPRWKDADQTKQWVRWDPMARNGRQWPTWWWGNPFRPETTPSVPEIVVDVPAGVPSPKTSSPWKVKAVKLMLRLRDGEGLTSHDFAEAGINITRFRQNNWICDTGRRDGRRYVYGPGEGTEWDPPPDKQWPEIAVALRERKAT